MIFINGRFLTQKVTGVNRYAIGICNAFKQLGISFTIVVPNWFKGNITYPFIKYGNLKSHFWEQIDLYLFLKKNGNPFLLNFTGLGPVFYKNQLSTIHDLSYLHNKSWFSLAYYLYYSLLTPIMAKNAKNIITVSEFSKREIVKLLSVSSHKIIVAGLAPSALSHTSITENSKENTIELPKKYILAVSSIEPRKNFTMLLKAFTLIKDKECYLLVAGAPAKHFKEENIDALPRVTFMGYVEDSLLEKLYKNATAFTYLSLYEGFGIPPIEAMYYNCPVIVSDIEVLKETCADAALYANPFSETDIAEKIDLLIENQSLRKTLIENGKKNIARYSFTQSANKILDCIDCNKLVKKAAL